MSFARLHKLVTFLIAGLGLYALTIGGELGTAPSLLFAVGYGASYLAEEPLIARPAWVRGWTVAVVALFVVQVLRGIAGDAILTLGIEYAAFLQISRLMNRRTARDHQQIAVLAFLHLIAASVLSSSIGYAFTFLGFVIVTPWMLALSHLRREIEGYYPGAGGDRGRTVADVRRVLSSRRVIGPGFLAATALLTLPIFAVTVALFLLFPRVGMGFLSFGHGPGQQTAGFGRNVELGGFGVIRDDPTVVLRVTPPGLGADPPAWASLRMRGTSFDHYDGRRWTRSASGAVQVRRLGEYYPIERWSDPDRDLPYRILLDHLDESVIFLPEGTVGVTIPPRVRGGLDVGRQIYAAPGHDFRYLDDDDLGLTYTAWVSTDPDEVGLETLTDEERALHLQMPPGMERVARLARRVTAGAQTDAERALRVQSYLRDSGTFSYTLEQPDTRGRDPLEVFLFDAEAGHCEYFSTAMAVMLRAVDVPTRNVTGFVGGRYNQYGGYYALRQGDAHSWVEAYTGDRWAPFDPTPPGRDELQPSESWLADVRAFFDALRTRWSRDVVGYDLHAQVSALRRAFDWLSTFRRGGGETQADDESEREASGAVPTWSVFVLAAGALLALLLARRLRRRARSPRAPGPGPSLDAVRIYRELERALARRGRPRPPASTPAEHAARLCAEGFAAADAVREVTDRYVAARYGGASLDAGELARLRSLVARVRSEKTVRSDR